MAVTSTAFGNDTGSSTTTVATGSGTGTVQNLNVTTGQPIIGAYACVGAGTVSSVTDTIGNTYTVLTPETTFGATVVIFYCASSTGTNSANVITVTISAAAAFKSVAAVTGTGFDTASILLDQSNNAAAAATSISPAASLNCGTSDAMLFEVSIATNDRAFDQTASCVEIYDAFDAFGSRGGAYQYKNTTGGGSQTISAAVTGGVASNLQIATAAFKLLPAGPTINTNPSDQTVFDGGTASFSVSATTSGGALTYQWQDNNSGSFANIGGATSSTLTVQGLLAMNGRLYRCNVTDSNGTNPSGSATLFVRTITAFWPPRPITQPPFRRAKSTLWLLDPANWGRASLNVGKWFADEMPTGAASPDVTKALTGVNATGSVGTVVSNVSYAITGNQASGSVGTVKSAVSYALTGNAATGQVGTVVSSITYALSGVQATGSVGTVTVAATDVTLALTGVSATGQVGTLSPNVAYVLTGNQATGQVGTVTSAVSYALTGVAATGNVGAVVSNISYALTGNQATGQVGTVAGVVSFALTGNAATGAVGTVVSNITYGLTGNQATGQVGTVSAGNDVTFALTGVQATGNVGAVTPSITYALTGVQASGQVGTVTASPSYGLTGNQATGQVGTLTSAVAYGLTGAEGAGQVGNVSIPGDVTIALTGVQATGYVGDLLLQIASNVPAGGSGGYEHEAAIIRYRRAVAQRQREAEIAAKAKAESDEAQQRLNTANTKRQREKETRIIEKLRAQEEAARTLEEQLMVEIELLQRAILGANTAAKQTAMQAEEEEFALMFALTTLI